MLMQKLNCAFYIVDVFAEEKYAGNQLSVITEASKLSTLQMQQIANEMHFSETTFITSCEAKNGGYDVRIFTPKQEVPFAGHPTLGTAFVIKDFVAKGKAEVLLNLKAGQIPVSFQEANGHEVGWMKQNAPVFGKKFEATRLAPLIGIDVTDFDTRFPIQEVSTGLPFIIVPLKTLSAVKKARVDQVLWARLAKESMAGILTFCPEPYAKSNDLNVRVFVDAYGIPEDPATGSGNGCLAAYLSKYRYLGNSEVQVKVEQGCEIGRPSLLYLRAKSKNNRILVEVGGKVVLVARGKLL
jgi:trans-2,3-dihydro-3-hydroxyanthranilate isomerase